MATGREASENTDELVERFLAGHSEPTRRAYAADLEDFARFLGRARAEAVGDLLAGREQGRRLVLDFAVESRWRGLAPPTVRRRLRTLSSLVRRAGELGLVEWSLEVPSDEEVGTAATTRRPANDGADVAYFMPRHEAEIDRLDVQHYALSERLGANYLAALDQPARILDVGCGTGLWAYEVGAEFPDAHVVGLDLAPSKQPWPAGYGFVRANLLHGLPFADDRFDFVHQRALVYAVPVKSWQAVVQDLVRVARPGGWVELVEPTTEVEPAGPATERLIQLVQRLGTTRGLDSTGIVSRSLDRYLVGAGVTNVEKHVVQLPLGEWGGRTGSLMATDNRALFMRLAPVFEAMFGVPERECLELVAAMHRECDEHRASLGVAIALGRKPN